MVPINLRGRCDSVASIESEQATPGISYMLQARLGIQSDIDMHTRAIFDLKSSLNTLTPIGNLPPELLSEILLHRAIDDYRGADYSNRLPWIRLSHVSRHFRAITLSTPQFWSYLRLTKSRVFFELLARSASAPLHITAHALPSSDRILALEMLLPHSRRLRELKINGTPNIIQSLCSKTVSPFDALEILELTCPLRPHTFSPNLPPAIPILASSTAPPRLRHLELRRFPFYWNDLIFSSPVLTTLVVTGHDSRCNRPGASLPNVGSFDALFSALAAVAPRLEVLDLEHSIPTEGLTVADPTRLPLPSQTIPLSSIKHIRLVGGAVYIAHLLNHISSPSTASLHVIARDPLGNEALAQSVAEHMSQRSPFVSLHLEDTGTSSLTVSGWTYLGTSGDALLKVTFGLINSREDVFSVLGGLGNLFTCIQELTISGTLASAKWANIFTRFPNMRTLVIDEHPEGNILSALTTVCLLKDGKMSESVVAPSLRVLRISDFSFSMVAGGLESFNGLLDLAIFRCNYDIPIDEIRLNDCHYATEKQVERLKEVVVDVEWNEYQHSDSDEDVFYNDSDSDSDFGYGSYNSDFRHAINHDEW